MIDTIRLNLDLARLAAHSISLKKVLRARWERPMADEQRALLYARARATELHVLLAASRGRLHTRVIPRAFAARAGTLDVAEWHARVAERAAKDYAVAAATAEAG